MSLTPPQEAITKAFQEFLTNTANIDTDTLKTILNATATDLESISSLKKQLEDKKSNQEQITQKLQREIQKLKKQLQDANEVKRENLEQAKKENEKLKKQLEDKKSNQEKKITQELQKTESNKLKKINETLKKKNSELIKKLIRLNQQIKELNEENQKLNNTKRDQTPNDSNYSKSAQKTSLQTATKASSRSSLLFQSMSSLSNTARLSGLS